MTNLVTYIDCKVGKFIGEGSLTGLTIRKMGGVETLDLKVKAPVGLEFNPALVPPLLRLTALKEFMIYLDCSASYPGIIAAAAMSFASVSVITNALRLRRAQL